MAIATLLALGGPVAASHIGGRSWGPSSVSAAYGNRSIRTSQDGYRLSTYLSWDATHFNALRNRITATGWRFTQEQNDFGDNLTAGVNGGEPLCQNIMRGTTFPAPVFDTDDDDGNRRHEEAEVTANTAAFPPSANTVYSFWQDWSRWQYWGWDGYQCTDWRYDGGSGSWKHLSQLSAWAGEWNAQEWTTEYKTTTYSAASLAAGASVNAIREDPVGADTTRPSGGTEMPPLSAMVAGVAVTVDAAGGESDVRVLPPSVSDLPSYQKATATRAESVTAGDGPYDATITLRHPISADALAAIDQVAGVTVIWYEAIGALADGSLLTISGTMESLPFLKATFRAEQAAPMGIVAAEMMLADARAFEHVDQHEDVLLVDMTGEYVKRQLRPGSSASETIAGDRVDIVLDDIYWQHAGLFD